MPKISSFAYCAPINLEKDQNVSIIPLNIIPIESIPGRFSFSIIFSIVGFSNNEDHSGYLIFADPNGAPVIQTEKYNLEKEDKRKSLLSGVSMGVDFQNVLFECEGLYKTELFFDNQKIAEFVIPVGVREEVISNG